MSACLIEWLKLSENLKLFETFEWEGIKWLFPFAFEFKFIQSKSMREDDMTSSNKGFEKWIWKLLKIFNLESISFLALFWNSKEFSFTCLKFQKKLRGGIWPSKPGAFLWNI